MKLLRTAASMLMVLGLIAGPSLASAAVQSNTSCQGSPSQCNTFFGQ